MYIPIIIIITIIIEILTIDLVSIWFAAGSIVALIAYLLNAIKEKKESESAE